MKAEFQVGKSVEELSSLEKISGCRVQKKCKKGKSPASTGVMDDKEKMEIKAYLNKLQEIVPFMPKDKKLSKVEVISYVIEYIRELRVTLGLPPCSGDQPDFEDMEQVLTDQSASPAVMMSMALMTHRSGGTSSVVVPELVSPSSVASGVNTSISSQRTVVSLPGTGSTSTATSQQQQSRQPLGVILNPPNYPATSSPILSNQMVHKSAVFTSSGK